MSLGIVLAAAFVAFAAAALLYRELRGNQREPARAVKGPLASVAAEAEDDEDWTTVGSRARAPRTELVRLALDEPDEESGRSEVVTLFEQGADVDEPTNPRELFFVAAVAQSDRGTKRRRNEDSYLILEEEALFVVADGMGGYAGGDVASRLAVDTVGAAFRSELAPAECADGLRPPRAVRLVSAFESAHDAIVDHASRHPDLRGMGTTLVGARFSSHKKRVYIAHVGDSRCYRLRRGELKLLTADHTLAARGIPAPMGNSIRRAVGVGRRVKVDVLVDVPHVEDVYLLCSDGLNKMVSDDVIREAMVQSTGDRNGLDSLAQRLVEVANQAGGKDNVTALVARVSGAPLERRPTSAPRALTD